MGKALWEIRPWWGAGGGGGGGWARAVDGLLLGTGSESLGPALPYCALCTQTAWPHSPTAHTVGWCSGPERGGGTKQKPRPSLMAAHHHGTGSIQPVTEPPEGAPKRGEGVRLRKLQELFTLQRPPLPQDPTWNLLPTTWLTATLLLPAHRPAGDWHASCRALSSWVALSSVRAGAPVSLGDAVAGPEGPEVTVICSLLGSGFTAASGMLSECMWNEWTNE